MQRKNYTTKTRSEILEFLQKNSTSTLSASDIIKYLHDNNMNVNRTTVYRYLDKLVLDKTLIKYDAVKGGETLYQLSHTDSNSCHDHLHLTCSECGKIIHLDCCFMKEIMHHLDEKHDFLLKCEGSMLYGICKECRKKLNKKHDQPNQ